MHNGKASNSMNSGSSFHEDEARVVDVRTDYLESIYYLEDSRIGFFFDSHFVQRGLVSGSSQLLCFSEEKLDAFLSEATQS